jgi:alanyl-tRNA synthetase
LFVHVGVVKQGVARVGAGVEAKVDTARRQRIRANHSATHLLHEALRRRLGLHVAQRGSLVAPERLRFDISHNKPMEAADLAWIEAEVNARIRENAPVTTTLMSPEAAQQKGAMALFGEKYGEEVRVVAMGRDAAMTAREGNYSVELCGGTHARATGEIGVFRLLSESAVSAGVRRVEALTGEAAMAHISAREAALASAAAAAKSPPEALPERIVALLEDRRRLEREVSDLKKKLATGGESPDAAEDVGGVKFAGRVIDIPARDLKGMAEAMQKAIGGGVVALISTDGGKASVVVSVGPALVDRFNAIDLVRRASEAMGGKGGGGRPDMAQAGGPDIAAASAALAAVKGALAA